jgi:hypothetical protein
MTDTGKRLARALARVNETKTLAQLAARLWRESIDELRDARAEVLREETTPREPVGVGR